MITWAEVILLALSGPIAVVLICVVVLAALAAGTLARLGPTGGRPA